MCFQKKNGEKLTFDDLINWNRTCNGENSLSPHGVEYSLPNRDTTMYGLMEMSAFHDFCKNENNDNFLQIIYMENAVGIKRRKTTENHLKKTMGQLIDAYYEEIEPFGQDTSEDQHLQAAVKLVQKLHRMHPFGRGNARTFYIFALNKLLLDQGLPMSIPNDLWLIDGSSVKEAVKIVKDGQKYLQDLGYPPTSQANQLKTQPVGETSQQVDTQPSRVSFLTR